MSAILDRDVAAFETHRRALTGLAYRMLGSRAEAEDVVQDAYLRWHTADHAAINEPRRYLGTVVTRLCLDRMKSAQARRETYVGQWLPEPLVDESFGDDTAGDLAHVISIALMLVLERLSPLERASFLLHDVFGVDFAEVSRTRSAAGRPPVASSPRAPASISRQVSRVLPHRARMVIAWPRPFTGPRRRAIYRRCGKYWPRMSCSIPMEAANAPLTSIPFTARIRSCASSPALRARERRSTPCRSVPPLPTA